MCALRLVRRRSCANQFREPIARDDSARSCFRPSLQGSDARSDVRPRQRTHAPGAAARRNRFAAYVSSDPCHCTIDDGHFLFRHQLRARPCLRSRRFASANSNSFVRRRGAFHPRIRHHAGNGTPARAGLRSKPAFGSAVAFPCLLIYSARTPCPHNGPMADSKRARHCGRFIF